MGSFSTFNISGLASGLDTNSMITELMRLERLPVTRYQQRQTELGKVDAAWGTVNTKLSAVRSAVDTLRKPDAFARFVASSSSDEAVATVNVTGTPAAGSLSFGVTQLAKSHQLAFAEVGAADASLWSGAEETLTLTKGGETHQLKTTSTTTLASLAKEINGLGAGMSAQVVQTTPGAFRLVVSSSATGTANAIGIGGAPAALGTATDLQTAADAVLDLGGGVTVSRSSNTITDLVDGVSVQLKQVGTTTVSTARDDAAAVDAVKKMVDSLNGVLSTVKDLTKYSPDTKVAGVLQGDPTARKLAMDLRTAVSSTVGNLTGAYTAGSSVGLSLTRDGTIALDTAKLQKALGEAPDAVANLFNGRSGTTTDPAVTFASSSDRTTAGTYGVDVTASATLAQTTGAAFVAGAARTMTVTVGGSPVEIALADGDDATTVAGKVNSALDAAGHTSVRADVLGGALRLQESRYGAAHSFAVAGSGDWGLDGTFTGTDVAGKIGGRDAVGAGRVLKSSAGQSLDLAVTVTAGAPGSYGTVTVAGGISAALDGVLRWAEGDKYASDPNEATGSLQRARNTLKSQIRRFDDQIAAFEVRLESRETTLRKKFAALETALSSVQSQTSFLGMLPTQSA